MDDNRIESLTNDDPMATKTAKNIGKTTTLHVHVQHPFLYISSPSLHDKDVKHRNFTYYGGREHEQLFSFF